MEVWVELPFCHCCMQTFAMMLHLYLYLTLVKTVIFCQDRKSLSYFSSEWNFDSWTHCPTSAQIQFFSFVFFQPGQIISITVQSFITPSLSSKWFDSTTSELWKGCPWHSFRIKVQHNLPFGEYSWSFPDIAVESDESSKVQSHSIHSVLHFWKNSCKENNGYWCEKTVQPPLRSKIGMGTTQQQGLVCKNGRKATQLKSWLISLWTFT